MDCENGVGEPIPVVEAVEFPLVRRGGLERCRQAIEKAEKAVERARAQLACVELELFFEAHPEIEQVSFDGEWESNDEGGSDFYLSASFEFAGGSPNADSLAELEREEYELRDEATSIVDHWKRFVAGESISRAGVRESLGSLLMSQEEYARWMADLDRFEIGRASGAASCASDGSARL